jgi:uncharacterized protein (TIGR03382 family)
MSQTDITVAEGIGTEQGTEATRSRRIAGAVRRSTASATGQIRSASPKKTVPLAGGLAVAGALIAVLLRRRRAAQAQAAQRPWQRLSFRNR